MPKLSDEQLLGAIRAAEADAIGSIRDTVAADRADATDRYLGKVYGNEQVGRSSVVSRDVADVVDGVLANVIKPFVAGDQVVQFTPRGPEDELQAQQESDYCNFIALERNNGYHVLVSSIKDALLLRNGYIKAGWTKRSDVMLERYEGMTDDEMAILAQDAAVEIVEHSEYPDMAGVVPGSVMPMGMLHDVRVRRRSAVEYVEILTVPPDEILVSERATAPSVQQVDFVQHRTHKTLSELRQLGYDVDDDISDDDSGETLEDLARDRYGSGDKWDDETSDPSRRLVLFRESWLRVDHDGDGIAELRRVCSVGARLLANDEAEFVPLACFTGTIMSHQHLGISVYDQVQDLALLKTALLRQFMDNKYLANNGRTVVDVNRVNLDDLTVSRPGGIVRSQGDPASAVMPLTVPDTGPSALMALEYLDSVRENRTGFTRYAQGMGSDSLVNKTATGLMQATSQSQMRLEMIARTIAETGVRDLFAIIHALTLKHSTKAEKVQLRGKWVEVNPREWVRRADLQISVGLGAGNSDQTLAKLNALAPLMQQASAAGLAGPQEFYNFGAEILKAAGYKNPDKFIRPPTVDPQTGQPSTPPTKPDPAVMAAQEQGKALMQAEQIKATSAENRAQVDAAVKMQQAQIADGTERYRILVDAATKLLISRRDQEVEVAKIAADANQRSADAMQAATEARGVADAANAREQPQPVDLSGFMQAIQGLVEQLNAPREIVRGPDGRAIGVRSVLNS